MSENIDGGLGFVASLDIKDFNISAEAMERKIRNVSNVTIDESAKMEQSIMNFAQNGARFIIGTLVGGGMMGLVNSIIQTRGQFQQLSIAFETMLGSGSKAQELMDQIVNTAAKTPFDLLGLAGGAKQLMAYGAEANKVNDILVRLGNIASGLSIPLNDIVYLYGTTMVQGRLYAQDVRQFTGRGIPLVKELAAMYGKTTEEINNMVSAGKIGFSDVEKVLNKLTDSGGQFYNLMEKQSKSLTGMISNLGDAWDNALNKLGEQNQDVLAAGISGASYMVEHLEDVLTVVKAIAIAYGSYKAAIVLNTLATKGYTGVALIDNTVRQAKLSLMRSEAVLTGENAAIIKKMEEAEKAHTAALQGKITVEQHHQALQAVRINAINELLTADQKRYLSNKNLTASSTDYIKEAESVLSVEQRMILSRQDLTTKGRAYADAIELTAKKNAEQVTNLKNEVKELSVRIPLLQDEKKAALENLEISKLKLIQAKESTNAQKIATAEREVGIRTKQLETASTELNTAATRKERVEKELATITTRSSTAAGMADVAAKNAQAASTSFLSAVTAKCTLAVQTLWAAMKANPFGWIITLAGMAYSAFTLFSSKADEVNKELTGMAKATKTATENFTEQAGKIDALQKILNSSNNSYKQRNKALLELKEIIPDYNAELSKEGKIINDNTEAISKYLTQLERQIKLKAAQEELEAAYKAKRSLEKEESTQSDKYWNIRQTNTLQGYDRNSLSAKTARLFGLEHEDNAKKALDETRKKISDVEATISSLNQEISTTSLELDNLNKTQVEINSENTINKRIKELQEERAAVEAYSEEYKELTRLIQEQQNKLPKNISTEESTRKAEQLAEQQRQSQIKLEQARIEIMEDGFEKRMALLDLQHKQTIASIDKEEKDLEKARKAAGKGSLNSKEKDSYNEWRSAETERYNREAKQMFLEEINFKKNQYQLYLRWSQTMDKDVANKRFADLLQGGSSYKEYLERMREQLNMKKQTGTLTDADTEFLFTLNLQYNEITGAKSAMDLFKESLSNAVSQAANLAERIEAVAQAKEKLANNEFGLINEDENAEANLLIEQMDVDNQRALQETIIKEYRSFEQKKLSIQKEYSVLKEQAVKDGNLSLLNELNRGENEAISRLNVEMLTQSEQWRNLFNNLDALTVSQISSLINKVNNQMSELSLQMDPADLKAILDRLQEAERVIIEKNPFKALSDSYSRMTKAYKDLDEAKRKGLDGEDLQKFEQIAKQSALNVADAIGGIKDIVLEVGGSLSKLADSFGNEELAEDISFAMEMVSGLGETAEGVAKLMAGDLMGGIKGVITGIANTISSIFNQKDKKIEKKIKSMQDEVEKLQKAYERLQRAIEKTYSNDVFNLMAQQEEALKEQRKLIEQQIQAEKDKKKTDKGKIKEWQDQLEQIDVLLEESRQKQIEMLAGTDVKSAIDEFADALVDAYSQGEDAAEALGEVTRKTLANAVKDALKRKFLADEIEKAVNMLADAIGDDGQLSDDEIANFEKIVNAAGNNFSKALEAYETLFKDLDPDKVTDSLTGAVQSMSEETGGIVAGRLNAVVINQADSNAMLRQSLLYHQEIAVNTRYNRHLEGIHEALNEIKNNNNGSSLLSQGIS